FYIIMALLGQPDHTIDPTNGSIIAYLGVIDGGNGISLVEYPDHRVPMDIKHIRALNPKAKILRVGDIDEHHRLSGQMGYFQSDSVKKRTQNEIQQLLQLQSRRELKTKVRDTVIFLNTLLRNIF
ncbi:hypothetical protein MK079_05515, partial [Candidatus Gracilibacteria bacterium]|nr:hypothetical protein [Candidatus Gracilibacteria bacterium]